MDPRTPNTNPNNQPSVSPLEPPRDSTETNGEAKTTASIGQLLQLVADNAPQVIQAFATFKNHSDQKNQAIITLLSTLFSKHLSSLTGLRTLHATPEEYYKQEHLPLVITETMFFIHKAQYEIREHLRNALLEVKGIAQSSHPSLILQNESQPNKQYIRYLLKFVFMANEQENDMNQLQQAITSVKNFILDYAIAKQATEKWNSVCKHLVLAEEKFKAAFEAEMKGEEKAESCSNDTGTNRPLLNRLVKHPKHIHTSSTMFRFGQIYTKHLYFIKDWEPEFLAPLDLYKYDLPSALPTLNGATLDACRTSIRDEIQKAQTAILPVPKKPGLFRDTDMVNTDQYINYLLGYLLVTVELDNNKSYLLQLLQGVAKFILEAASKNEKLDSPLVLIYKQVKIAKDILVKNSSRDELEAHKILRDAAILKQQKAVEQSEKEWEKTKGLLDRRLNSPKNSDQTLNTNTDAHSASSSVTQDENPRQSGPQ